MPSTAARRPHASSACGDPVRARRLAVGAGDADHPQRLRRAGRRRHRRSRRASPAGPSTGRLRQRPRAVPVEAAAFPEHRAGAARDRVGDERAAVGDARPDTRRTRRPARPAAVGGDPRRGRAEPRRAAPATSSSRVDGAPSRHVSSRTALPSGGSDRRCRSARRAARRACAALRPSRRRTPAPRRRRRSTAPAPGSSSITATIEARVRRRREADERRDVLVARSRGPRACAPCRSCRRRDSPAICAFGAVPPGCTDQSPACAAPRARSPA